MAKKAAKKKRARVASRTRAARRATSKRSSRRAAPKRTKSRAAAKKSQRRTPARRASRPSAASFNRTGVITHTELASTDPLATRDWAREVLGWEFGPPMATPTGGYHMWRFENGTGGGIRANNPPEGPGSIPYVEVESIQAAFAKALAHGAAEMFGPEALPDGMGWIAIVAAPGGVAIGFWSKQ